MGKKITKTLAELPRSLFVAIYSISYILNIVLMLKRYADYFDAAAYKVLFIVGSTLQMLLLGWIMGMAIILIICLIIVFSRRKEFRSQ